MPIPKLAIATVIKTVVGLDLDRWNRMKSPEVNPLLCGQLPYDKGAEPIHGGGEGQSFQQTVLGKLDIHKPKDEVGPVP